MSRLMSKKTHCCQNRKQSIFGKIYQEKKKKRREKEKAKFLFRVVNYIGCGKLSSQCLSTCGLNIFYEDPVFKYIYFLNKD